MEIYGSNSPIIRGDYDVIVIGGGVAGCAAALAAAREGADVLLIEKTVNLGGLATIGLINWYEPLCDGKGRKLIGGISEEMLYAAIKYGDDNLSEDWRNKGCSGEKDRRYVSHFSPTAFSLALVEMLLSAGVHIRYDTLATYPQMKNNICLGVLSETKSGTEYFGCKILIDASGDADMFYRAGCPCETGENFMSYVSHFFDFDKTPEIKMTSVRKWKLVGSGMLGEGQPADMPLVSGVESDHVTDHMLRGQMMTLDFLKTQDRKKVELVSLPSMAQFRTTRHIIGEYVMTGEDVYKTFEDSVGTFGDFFVRHRGMWYEIPYRSLYNGSFPNMLSSGRIISASGEAWKATRVIPVAALTGEISGVAAAIAIRENCEVSKVDLHTLRGKLVEKNNIVRH